MVPSVSIPNRHFSTVYLELLSCCQRKSVLAHAIKAYRGVEEYLLTFLTSELEGGEWSASHPA
jgi:hypothetical protein